MSHSRRWWSSSGGGGGPVEIGPVGGVPAVEVVPAVEAELVGIAVVVDSDG